MSKNITIWANNTIEYKRLELFKAHLDVIITENNLPIIASIQTTYFDYGQGWLWTTIIITELNNDSCINSYQLLYPARHEKIVFGNNYDICEVAEKVKEELIKRHKEDN